MRSMIHSPHCPAISALVPRSDRAQPTGVLWTMLPSLSLNTLKTLYMIFLLSLCQHLCVGLAATERPADLLFYPILSAFVMTNDFLYRSIPTTLSLEKFHTFGILHTIQPVGIITGTFLIDEVFIMSRGAVKSSAYHKVVSNVHFQFPFRPVACPMMGCGLLSNRIVASCFGGSQAFPFISIKFF